MAHHNTILGQMLQLVPRHVFDHIVDYHSWQSPRPRKLSYWSQLIAMIYAQLSSRKSLRDIEFSLQRHSKKLYHLGFSEVKRSTLADANEHRPAIIFEKVYHKLHKRLQREMAPHSQKSKNIKIIDATVIDLCASVFPWATFRATKGAIKLHTIFSLDDALPQCINLTEGDVHDITVARQFSFRKGDLLIMDRAYLDFSWLHQLHGQGVWFVTRLKSNSRFQVINHQAVDPDGPVLADQVIQLTTAKSRKHYPACLRRVHYRDPETGHEYFFLTNRFDLSALTIAELYRQRWQIELFFKWIKQNLKIKSFYGTSKNAVLIQVWTAIIAYLLLHWLKFKSKIGWSILEFSRMAQTILLERLNLWTMICPQNSGPPPKSLQLSLFKMCAGH
jgi:hypothetical protein